MLKINIKKTFLIVSLLLILSVSLIAAETTIVAEINDEEITLLELEEQANLQDLVMQVSQVNQEFAEVLFSTEEGQAILDEYQEMKLDELINERILIAEAEKNDITISESEKDEIFEAHIQLIVEQNDLSEEELLLVLAQQGIESLEEYQELILDEETLVLEKFLEEEVLSDYDLSDPNTGEILNNYIYELREEADINIYL
ncbi:SurA N-terminal domain-containing protein [Natronospora cellulosivora (SeqCode)]